MLRSTFATALVACLVQTASAAWMRQENDDASIFSMPMPIEDCLEASGDTGAEALYFDAKEGVIYEITEADAPQGPSPSSS